MATVNRKQTDKIREELAAFSKKGKVLFAARVILENNERVLLAPAASAIEQRTRGNPRAHPDQIYWNQQDKIAKSLASIDPAKMAEIEIDVSITPCRGARERPQEGCRFQILRRLMQTLENANRNRNLPVKIFTHREKAHGQKQQDEWYCYEFTVAEGSQNPASIEDRYDRPALWCWV